MKVRTSPLVRSHHRPSVCPLASNGLQCQAIVSVIETIAVGGAWFQRSKSPQSIDTGRRRVSPEPLADLRKSQLIKIGRTATTATKMTGITVRIPTIGLFSSCRSGQTRT